MRWHSQCFLECGARRFQFPGARSAARRRYDARLARPSTARRLGDGAHGPHAALPRAQHAGVRFQPRRSSAVGALRRPLPLERRRRRGGAGLARPARARPPLGARDGGDDALAEAGAAAGGGAGARRAERSRDPDDGRPPRCGRDGSRRARPEHAPRRLGLARPAAAPSRSAGDDRRRGLRLSPGRLTPQRLREAVERLLGDPSFRRNARRLADGFAEHDGPTRAAELLEQLAVTEPTAAQRSLS